jgi:hydrogenase accessory protein HypB
VEIKVFKEIMGENLKLAEDNKKLFKNRKITAINVMASPGAGKTSTIMKLISTIAEKANFGVIEGDIASSIDAEKFEKIGIPVVQINTGGGCHLDANMIKDVMGDFKVKDDSIIFIENVGNLVCPSSFDLGENLKMVIASVPEGHDKPYKYTSMFEAADFVVLNKVDLAPFIDFDRDAFYKGIKALNPDAKVFEVSCKTGEGFNSLVDYILEAHENGKK